MDRTTREFCDRCKSVSAVGFSVPDKVWRAVAGRKWMRDILCVRCFAQLGDEKHIMWDSDIEFWPVSYATHHYWRNNEQPPNL